MLIGNGGQLGSRRGMLEIAFEVGEGELPRVALIRDEALQDREVTRRRTSGLVIDPPRERRRMRKMRRLGEEAADFDIGIDAVLELAEHLHDEAIAEQNRSVALLRLEYLGFGKRATIIESAKRLGRSRDELVGLASAAAMPLEHR